MKFVINKNINLIEVNKGNKHIKDLFYIFLNRENKHNISNTKKIDFKTHKKFVLKHPYRKWYIIEYCNLLIGTLYLTKDNIIGIYIPNKDIKILKIIILYILSNFKPLPSIPSIRNENFLINIAVKNTSYIKIIEKMGAVKLQTTYSLLINELK